MRPKPSALNDAMGLRRRTGRRSVAVRLTTKSCDCVAFDGKGIVEMPGETAEPQELHLLAGVGTRDPDAREACSRGTVARGIRAGPTLVAVTSSEPSVVSTHALSYSTRLSLRRTDRQELLSTK